MLDWDTIWREQDCYSVAYTVVRKWREWTNMASNFFVKIKDNSINTESDWTIFEWKLEKWFFFYSKNTFAYGKVTKKLQFKIKSFNHNASFWSVDLGEGDLKRESERYWSTYTCIMCLHFGICDGWREVCKLRRQTGHRLCEIFSKHCMERKEERKINSFNKSEIISSLLIHPQDMC